jgi:trehalose-phosphatase
MKPTTREGAEGYAEMLRNPADALIAFDFDGTLAPIVDDPAAARAHPQAASALARLAPLVGTVAIITGRPAAVAVEYGSFERVEGLIVLGQYGLERWTGGVLTTVPPPPGVATVREKLPRVLAAAGAPAEVFVEDKGHALAVHTRRCAEPEVALERLRSVLIALAERHGLIVEPGRLVLELRPPGMDKGVALRALCAEHGSKSVMYAGDDLGDLAAYDAMDEMTIPAVKVCSGSAEVTELAARCDLVVDGPSGVIALVTALCDALEGKLDGKLDGT